MTCIDGWCRSSSCVPLHGPCISVPPDPVLDGGYVAFDAGIGTACCTGLTCNNVGGGYCETADRCASVCHVCGGNNDCCASAPAGADAGSENCVTGGCLDGLSCSVCNDVDTSCQQDSDCCSMFCNIADHSYVCQCKASGTSCLRGVECCSGLCFNLTCG